MLFLAAASVLLGLYLAFAAVDSRTRQVNWFTLVMGLLLSFVCGPAAFAAERLGAEINHGLLLSVLGIVAGAVIVAIMIGVFANSSPFSTDMSQWMVFGSFKWDDFAYILLGGAFLLYWGGTGLFGQVLGALSLDSPKAAIVKVEQKPAAATSSAVKKPAPTASTGTKKTTHRHVHHARKHASRAR